MQRSVCTAWQPADMREYHACIFFAWQPADVIFHVCMLWIAISFYDNISHKHYSAICNHMMMQLNDIIKLMTRKLLAVERPDLLTEWDYEKNNANNINVSIITTGSGVKAWWKCDECHGSYDMVVKEKVKGYGCPYCAGRRVLAGFNDLQSLYPELIASEWDWAENDKHSIKPDAVTSGNRRKAYWYCETCNGHYDMMISDKVRGIGCPYCAGKRVLRGYNDLLTLCYELIESQWDYVNNNANGLHPDAVTTGSGVKALWHCETCNGLYMMRIADKTSGHGCPYCAGQKVLKGFNDLQSNHPDLVNSEWNWTENNKLGLKPDEITCSTGRKASWHCDDCNGDYMMSIKHKTRGVKCPYCAGKRVLKGYNDLNSMYPELVQSEWDYEKNNAIGLKPDAITAGSHRKANWHCTICKGDYMMTANDKTRPTGCPYCAGQKVLRGFNDLQSNYPELIASEWDYSKNDMMGIHPDEITCNSSVEASWSCSHGHSWNAVVSNRIGRGSGCPHCSHKISEQENQVAEFMNDYLCSHYAGMKYSMHRSIKFKRIYDLKKIKPDDVLTDCLKQHLLKELDIYIPELSLAIEYDGDYWHSDEIMMETRGFTNSESHWIKQELCRQAGVELVFISEHDWLNENWKVKSMLQSLIASHVSNV